VVLSATRKEASVPVAGLIMGFVLALVNIMGIAVDGASVNPARSFGPAVVVGGLALSQLWLFLIAPLVGAVLGAGVFMLFHPGAVGPVVRDQGDLAAEHTLTLSAADEAEVRAAAARTPGTPVQTRYGQGTAAQPGAAPAAQPGRATAGQPSGPQPGQSGTTGTGQAGRGAGAEPGSQSGTAAGGRPSAAGELLRRLGWSPRSGPGGGSGGGSGGSSGSGGSPGGGTSGRPPASGSSGGGSSGSSPPPGGSGRAGGAPGGGTGGPRGSSPPDDSQR
jgi:Major intrinsic protein